MYLDVEEVGGVEGVLKTGEGQEKTNTIIPLKRVLSVQRHCPDVF